MLLLKPCLLCVSFHHFCFVVGDSLVHLHASESIAFSERACSGRVNNFNLFSGWNEETGSSVSLLSILLLAYFPLLAFCIPNAMNKSGPKDLEGGTAVTTQKIESMRLVLQL